MQCPRHYVKIGFCFFWDPGPRYVTRIAFYCTDQKFLYGPDLNILSENKILTAEKLVKLKFAYETLKIAKFTDIMIVNVQILLKLWIKECEMVFVTS